MATFNIKINEARQVEMPRNIEWGCVGESKIEKIVFELPETINGTPTDEFSKIVEFECADSGYKFSKDLYGCECEICNVISKYRNLKAQVVLMKLIDETTEEYIVWKSEMFNIHFDESINATEKIKMII